LGSHRTRFQVPWSKRHGNTHSTAPSGLEDRAVPVPKMVLSTHTAALRRSDSPAGANQAERAPETVRAGVPDFSAEREGPRAGWFEYRSDHVIARRRSTRCGAEQRTAALRRLRVSASPSGRRPDIVKGPKLAHGTATPTKHNPKKKSPAQQRGENDFVERSQRDIFFSSYSSRNTSTPKYGLSPIRCAELILDVCAGQDRVAECCIPRPP